MKIIIPEMIYSSLDDISFCVGAWVTGYLMDILYLNSYSTFLGLSKRATHWILSPTKTSPKTSH